MAAELKVGKRGKRIHFNALAADGKTALPEVVYHIFKSMGTGQSSLVYSLQDKYSLRLRGISVEGKMNGWC